MRNQDLGLRRPTRTDAAMVAGVIDAALTHLETALAEEADLMWAGGFRYASFLDDPRPLALLLEDAPMRLLRAQVDLAGGLRSGEILLALPAEGRGRHPKPVEDAVTADQGPAFSQGLSDRVQGAQTRIEAVLARLSLPLAQVMALSEGMVLPLQNASINQISLEGLDGRLVAEGRLGQNRGMRAIRLTEKSGTGDTQSDLSPTVRPWAADSGQDFPVADFPAMPEIDLKDFLATGTD